MSIVQIISPLLLVTSAPVADGCIQVPGWEEVLAQQEAQWIVIGEFHGSNESPALFADLVCQAGQLAPIVVGLEFPQGDQPLIDAFIASDGGETARTAFLQATIWTMPFKDGRSSVAMFALIERLRALHAAGLVARVVAFQADDFTAPPSPEEYEQAMAAILIEAGAPGTKVVALVGNIHAMLTQTHYRGGYLPMAGHLPAANTLSFNTVDQGGESWVCTGPDECGAQSMGRQRLTPQRGIALLRDDETLAAYVSPMPEDAYSGIVFTGSASTASPPQIPAPEEDANATQ